MTLHERIAEKLGWPLQDVKATSPYSLRELVMPLDPPLADEITQEIKRLRKII
jgi:hypothetical protein